MKKFLAFTMAAALTLSLAACGGGSGSGSNAGSDASSSGSNTASGAAFKLGGTGPLTGSASIYGLAAQRGAEIAVEEINAQGEILLCDVFMNKTLANLEKDAHVSVVVYEGLEGYQIKGSAEYVTQGPVVEAFQKLVIEKLKKQYGCGLQ